MSTMAMQRMNSSFESYADEDEVNDESSDDETASSSLEDDANDDDGDGDGEEEEEDYVTDNDDDPSLRSKCLPFDTLRPDFETEEPIDGFEYLRRVRFEASKIPNVVVSNVNPRDYDEKRTPEILKKHGFVGEALGRKNTLKILDLAKKNTEWTRAFLKSFSDLRVSMRRAMDAYSEEEEEEKEEFNSKKGKKNSRKYIAPEKLEGVPLLSDVIAIDDVTVNALFRKYCFAFSESSLEESEEEEKEKLKHAWFFALAVRVSMPIDQETQAAVRRVSRIFAKLLSSSSSKSSCSESSASRDDDDRNAALNVGLTIAWKYFAQQPFDDFEIDDGDEISLANVL